MDYSLLQWVVYVFLGGAINAVVIRNFVDWYKWAMIRFEAIQIAPQFIVYGIFVFLTPLIISWFFSRRHPEKRIVPPLYMQGIAFGLLLFFVYNALVTDFQTYYFIAMYAFSAGIIQDGIMGYFLGKNALSEDIIRHSFAVHSDVARVQEIVMSKQFRTLLGLKRIVKEKGETLKLRSSRKPYWQIVLEVKETGEKGETIVNLAVYDERRYNIEHVEKTDDVYEYAMSKIGYIKDYFMRRHSLQVDNAPMDNAESLVSYVLDDLQGTLTRFQEMTRRKQLSIIAMLVFVLASVGLFAFDRIDAGLATLAIAVALIIDVIRD
jgi:hypothetical protein